MEVGNPPPHCVVEYKAGGMEKFDNIIALPTVKGEWHPSIHMPKEAARLFLRVTDVVAERLKNITDKQAEREGIREFWIGMGESGYAVSADSKTFYDGPIGAFAHLWNSCARPSDLPLYGWEANPWVWVIEFERISKEAALEEARDT